MMYEPGIYCGPVTKFGLAEKRGTKPYFWIEFTPTYVSSGGEWRDVPTQATRTLFMYVSDASLPYTLDKLAALGFNGDFAAPRISDEAMANITVECRHEMYDGKLRDKWELYREGGGIQHEPADANLILRLNAQWREKNKAKPTTAARSVAPPKSAIPPPPQPPVPEADAPPSGDDLPF